jgi:hypothetical protein
MSHLVLSESLLTTPELIFFVSSQSTASHMYLELFYKFTVVMFYLLVFRSFTFLNVEKNLSYIAVTSFYTGMCRRLLVQQNNLLSAA